MEEMLTDKIKAAESRMKTRLEETRASFSHPGNKGAQVEKAFRAFLQQYLPRRLTVGHGEAVDTKGHRSGQLDVVVANEDHPFTFAPDEAGLFFMEGLSAAGEVKSVLTSKDVLSTINRSKKWKRLWLSPGPSTMVRANEADLERFYEHPPFFLFAMESEITLETLHERLASYGSYGERKGESMVDAAFLLDRGWVIDFGTGEGSFQFRTKDEGESLPGWHRSPSERVLFDFLSWLSTCMPFMIRFKRILPNYLFGDRKS